MKTTNYILLEELQKLIIKTLATNPAGRNLFLIGGTRYRLLDGSIRRSIDIDYHWRGDLKGKQTEIISLFQRKLLPEVKRTFDLEGSVASGPLRMEDESDQVKIVELAFYRPGVAFSRIEVPVEITVADQLDPPEIRTADGIVYPTLSDADLIENKVIALLNRVYIQARDILDIFLFQNTFLPQSRRRILKKLGLRRLKPGTGKTRLKELEENRERYIAALKKVIEEHVEPSAAENILSAGGAPAVFDQTMVLLRGLLPESNNSEFQ
jgi:predicted nucleotidyltransferase component of viral defense system